MIRLTLKNRKEFELFWRKYLLEFSHRNPESALTKYDVNRMRDAAEHTWLEVRG